VSVTNGEHYTWGEACDGWHLVKSEALSVIQERVPAGAGEVMHIHEHAPQFFYVLEGQGTMVTGDGEITLQRGSGLEVPAGVPHHCCNRSAADVVFLVVSSQRSHGDRINL
jgi:mannose-6-phosphate isomerase-like protein (cupin superfamily)